MNKKTVEQRLDDLEERVNILEQKRKTLDYLYDPDVKDELYEEAVKTIKKYNNVSASLLQRKLVIGYARAARIIDQLEMNKLISSQDGAKPRKVLVR